MSKLMDHHGTLKISQCAADLKRYLNKNSFCEWNMSHLALRERECDQHFINTYTNA